jgi:DNA ligase (NAD+)
MLEVTDQRGLQEFDRAIRHVLGTGSPEYTVEPRPSGVQVVLAYDRGSLSGAVAGGDRFQGEDVLRNVKTILTVPLFIGSVVSCSVPPEHMKVWGVVYDERSAQRGLPPAESGAGAVAAALIGADLRVTARRPLNLFCFGAERESELGAQVGVGSHYELMLMLQDLGFRVNRPHISRCSDISAVIETISSIEEQAHRSPYEVDGALVQVNPLAQRATIEGALGHQGIVAYGFRHRKSSEP